MPMRYGITRLKTYVYCLDMLDMNFVKLEKKENYALVCLDRPKALNALNDELLNELELCLKELSSDPKMRAILLYGSTERAFAAGADVAAMQKMSPAEIAAFCQRGTEVLRALESAKLISIAAVSGFALGGGLELALACDMRLANETASFALPEVGLGLIPGFGGTQRLARLVGQGLALEMVLSGKRITARRAYEMGLINALYPTENFIGNSESFVQEMLEKNAASAQLFGRAALREGLELSLEKGLQREQEYIRKISQSQDLKEGLDAFTAKRPPRFSNC